ncbi:hypothetical protein HF086_015614 [Spodoptera exigua]|uniref:RRM domain-containing protein n=1 Tax=Spodoptera exigua TaxID=7107 RepID=A0A922MQ98_SPOEX|nr:hypothetical protein HF086_015614 [Spodoptera exigua]
MRRKSERTASKKGKASPEKKIEKVKRPRTRRKKQSSSSENESADDGSPVREVESVVDAEKKPPSTPAKEDSPEEAQDQVWRVKTTEASGDIKKLKICLTRPPSTPERVDRSPRSKRKHSRATSSSDTPSVEGVEERKKPKHRSKRALRGSKDDTDKNNDSQGDEPDQDSSQFQDQDKSSDEVTQSETVEDIETPVSTTNEEMKVDESKNVSQSSEDIPTSKETASPGQDDVEKASDADTTVVSPKSETRVASPLVEVNPEPNSDIQDEQPSNSNDNKPQATTDTTEKESPRRTRSESVDKSEVLELHPDDSKCESSDNEANQSKAESEQGSNKPPEENPNMTQEDTKPVEPQEEKPTLPQHEEESTEAKDEEKPIVFQDEEKPASEEQEVSIINEENIHKETEKVESDCKEAINETDVVESSEKVIKENQKRKLSTDNASQPMETEPAKVEPEQVSQQPIELHRSDSVKSTKEEPVANGQAAPAVVPRKRRWGSRSSKLTTQKSITISTDVLKDIIPDVKPVEFDEVIEEKKHRRIEAQERIERPVLPKIIIDNTDNVELNKESEEDQDPHTPKPRDLASNRKISIIKDNDSIIARPPSPPRNKQSCILYITNLVRPFTLPQLKNLLQRTGRIVENGFWIDRIKSKCFVEYETEDQAVETRHALHGVTWPVSNPKTLQVDFSTQEAFEKAKSNEETDATPVSAIPGTVEDWLREQDMKRDRGDLEKPWERKAATREWDLGKNEKDKDNKDSKSKREERPADKRRHRSQEKSPEPARKFKKKEEEAPAKLLDDLFRKTKTTPCIYWLPLSAETARSLWFVLAAVVACATAQQNFSIADFLSGQFSQRGFTGRWISDTRFTYTVAGQPGILQYDCATDTSSVLVSGNLLEQLETNNPILSPDEKFILASRDVQSVDRDNPNVILRVVNLAQLVANPTNPSFIRMNAPTAVTADHILGGVTWVNDNEIAMHWMNRRQNYSEEHREEPKGWIPLALPRFSKDGEFYVSTRWSLSQADGNIWQHLYLSMRVGNEIISSSISPGASTVNNFIGMDETPGRLAL